MKIPTWLWLLGGGVVAYTLFKKTGTTPTPGTVGPTTSQTQQIDVATKSAAIIEHVQKYYQQVQSMNIKVSIVFADGLYRLVLEGSKEELAAGKTLDELATAVTNAMKLAGLDGYYSSFEPTAYL